MSTDDRNMSSHSRTGVVSIIMPVHNGEPWLTECLESVVSQTFNGSMELSVYNDASTDMTASILEGFKSKMEKAGISMLINGHNGTPVGVGAARNRAIGASGGQFLCFLDADDVMDSRRIEMQLAAAVSRPNAIVGCQFRRLPVDSTPRFTDWCNRLEQEQLYTQAYTSHGPTVAMPTWFCSREVFDKIGKFDESGKGTPEDLIFFMAHLKSGGELYRVNEVLMMYRYHPGATTHSVHRETIWEIQVSSLEEQVLCGWNQFTIWNAGKQGRRFYRTLKNENKQKVNAFCDVDEKKIEKGVYIYEESKKSPKPRVPIVHFSDAMPPFIICMKQDLTGGDFEKNLGSLNLQEGKDYYFCS
ncbi:UDP-GlcNAc:betaGal beta-1,3-N-acetylglucosaminyltransferase-like protein 1 isoform X2 [Lytechinus variegatus]|uniref:UDP-GlcNAc:betaGal beta-1,3-N-acetylglucosaminyltransferase-like protein 1 isoform X2 n=1 Tax=Lytechinus variegatus TaxID=7654 RepID=UPI001BB1C5F6|nr:UDP-GlcNAc:betaGal beta-1,3-N-acetylglucosaminyltransferase-like protein 1 isoform X2 [Lytechinus variegatus]